MSTASAPGILATRSPERTAFAVRPITTWIGTECEGIPLRRRPQAPFFGAQMLRQKLIVGRRVKRRGWLAKAAAYEQLMAETGSLGRLTDASLELLVSEVMEIQETFEWADQTHPDWVVRLI